MEYLTPKPSPLVAALQKELEKAYRLDMPSYLISTKDFCPPTLQMQEPGTIVKVTRGERIECYALDRVCYHCDATDGVTGVVPLCRKCR